MYTERSSDHPLPSNAYVGLSIDQVSDLDHPVHADIRPKWYKDVVFEGGTTSATLTVPTVNDDRDERDSYIYIYLRHSDHCELGDDYFMEVFVENND